MRCDSLQRLLRHERLLLFVVPIEEFVRRLPVSMLYFRASAFYQGGTGGKSVGSRLNALREKVYS